MEKKLEEEKLAVEFAFKVLLLNLPEEKQKQFNGKLTALLAEVEKEIPPAKPMTARLDLKAESIITPLPKEAPKGKEMQYNESFAIRGRTDKK